MPEPVGGSASPLDVPDAADVRSVVRLPAAVTHPWRSPADQPAWARPALLTVAALGALAYAWGMGGAALESFYGAAARSMSTSWHDFFFGAFDPLGTISIDKLPGALWVQALSLRIFGFHVWAVVLPQVLEGVLAILVLYRAVRRLAGSLAGIAAAAVLAATPVTVLLNRGNVADSLLILLSVLAADAAVSALLSGRLRPLLLAGLWVGLAFQVKMMEAWLVLPALAVAYLAAAAPPRLRTRIGHVALAGAVTAVVSLSWMTIVALIPAHDRPYVDGTRNDSIFTQTFDYNGLARLGYNGGLAGVAGQPAPFLAQIAHSGSALNNPARHVPPSWHRLLDGLFGRDVGWLLPAALIAAVAVLYDRRRADRRDPLRACVLLWGTWLVLLAAFFSDGTSLNSYYVASLSPAIGALCGAGAALFWPQRHRRRARAMLAGAILATVGYGVYLLHGGAGVPGWLVPTVLCLGLAGIVVLLAPLWRSDPDGSPPDLAIALAAGSVLLIALVTAILTVTRGLGPFAAPYEPASVTLSHAAAQHARQLDQRIVEQLSSTYSTPIAFATDSSTLAGPYILYTGREILPIGGYEGGAPAPTLAQLQRYIAAGQLRAFLVPVTSRDPRIAWIDANCTRASEGGSGGSSVLAVYDCGGR